MGVRDSSATLKRLLRMPWRRGAIAAASLSAVLIPLLVWWVCAKGFADAQTSGGASARSPKDQQAAVGDLQKLLPAGHTSMRGFNAVKLGMSKDEVQRQCGRLAPSKWAGWLMAQDEQAVVFSDDKLVAYQKTYRGDNVGWVDKLKEALGPPQSDDKVFKDAKIFGEGTREDVAVWYDFSDSVANFVAVWNHQTGPEQQSVTAAIMDRDWLLKIQAQEMSRKREVLGWISKVVEDVDSGVEPDKLEPMPGTKIVPEGNNGSGYVFVCDRPPGFHENEKVIAFLNLKSHQQFVVLGVVRKAGRYGRQFFDPLKGQLVIAPEGSIAMTVSLDQSPATKRDLALVLPPLRSRIDVELAMAEMPSDDLQYLTATSPTALYPAYCWRFRKGWSIRVNSDNTVSLMKSSEPEKKL